METALTVWSCDLPEHSYKASSKNWIKASSSIDKIRAPAGRIVGNIGTGLRGEELAVSRGESDPPVVKENLVAVDPIFGLLADNVEEGVLAIFEGKYGVEIWKEELVA